MRKTIFLLHCCYREWKTQCCQLLDIKNQLHLSVTLATVRPWCLHTRRVCTECTITQFYVWGKSSDLFINVFSGCGLYSIPVLSNAPFKPPVMTMTFLLIWKRRKKMTQNRVGGLKYRELSKKWKMFTLFWYLPVRWQSLGPVLYIYMKSLIYIAFHLFITKLNMLHFL